MGRFFPFLLSRADDWRLGNPGSIKLLLFVMLQSPPLGFSSVGEGSPTGFHIEWKKGLLKFFIDGDTSQINFANGWLSQVSQSSRRRTDSLRLFGTRNVSPCLSSTDRGWHQVRRIYETRRRNKIGGWRGAAIFFNPPCLIGRLAE